jgi:hypothetical protein
VVGVSTVAQAVFAYLALRGLRDSRAAARAATEGLALTRETTQRQLRAYVCQLGAKHGPFVVGKIMTFRIRFENCGSTPAYGVAVLGAPVFLDPAEEFDYPQPPQAVIEAASRTTLGPGRRTTLDAWSDEPLTPEWLEKIERGELQVMVYGGVKYRDIFGAERETSFRVRYMAGALLQDGRLWLCAEGNDAT